MCISESFSNNRLNTFATITAIARFWVKVHLESNDKVFMRTVLGIPSTLIHAPSRWVNYCLLSECGGVTKAPWPQKEIENTRQRLAQPKFHSHHTFVVGSGNGREKTDGDGTANQRNPRHFSTDSPTSRTRIREQHQYWHWISRSHDLHPCEARALATRS